MKRSYRYLRYLVLLLMPLTYGCNESPTSATPDVIRIAPLPDYDPALMKKDYLPVIKYLEQSTGIKTQLVIANSYQHLLTLFQENKVDIANFGGVTFVKARKISGAKPMVFRNVDTLSQSVVLVHKDANENTLEELKGKSFSFGSALSTSGHLMPRHFFTNKNIYPEKFFSKIIYSGAHDKTAYMVKNKEVNAGVAHMGVINDMLYDGRLKESDVRVLWQSPTYSNYIWAIQPTISEEIKNRFETAFLNLQMSNPSHKNILEKLNATYYVTANNGDFSALEEVLERLGK